MINFFYELDFKLLNENELALWISKCISLENFKLGELNYIFCDDEYLLKKNVKYLKHNTLTDIISFDSTIGKEINGDIFISVDRVKENTGVFNTEFNDELDRVIVHGVLHFMKYNDKSDDEKVEMRTKENFYLSLR